MTPNYETQDDNVDQIISDYNFQQPESYSEREKPAPEQAVDTSPSESDTTLEEKQSTPPNETDSIEHNEQSNVTSETETHRDDTHLPSGIDLDDIVDAQLSESVLAMISNNDSPSVEQKESNPNTPSSRENTVSVTEILDWYEPKFQTLQKTAEQKLKELMDYALEEYNKKKTNNEKISYAYFFQKYNKAILELEKKTDDTFNDFYQSLQSDLTKHGFNKEHAVAYKELYEETKQQLRNEMTQKVMNLM